MRPRRSTVVVFVAVAVAWFGIGFASLVVVKADMGQGPVREVLTVIVGVAAFPVFPVFMERIETALDAIADTGDYDALESSMWSAFSSCVVASALFWSTVAAGAHALAPKLRAFWAS